MNLKHILVPAFLASGMLTVAAAVGGRVEKSSLRCWEKGETPAVTVAVRNPDADPVEAVVSLSLTTDTRLPFREYSRSVSLAAGDSAEVVFDELSLTPGFYRATVKVGDTVLDPFNLGYDPTSIVSPLDRQPDFGEFWHQALEELAAVAPEYKLTRDPYRSSANKNVYLVEMKSLPDSTGGEPVVIRGFYSEPTAPGKYPALISYQGYDGGTSQIYYGNPDDKPGWIEFFLSTRGQLLDNRDGKNHYGDWFAWNFGDKDKYYYRAAFMDVVRAIDFITSREKTDTARVYAQGQSQGGAFTVASAALGGGRIKAIAPAITFLGDYPDYFRIVHWPGEVALRCQKEKGLSDGEMYRFLSYFDTKNLAPWVKCPVLAIFGLQDPVCPPHTNFASFNLFDTADKRYIIMPENGHWVIPQWYGDFMDFFYSVMPQATADPTADH